MKYAQASFRMQMTVADGTVPTRLHALIAFDPVIETLVGCSAEEFDKHLLLHPDLLYITLDHIMGLRCDVVLRDTPRVKKHAFLEPETIVDSLIPREDWLPVTHPVMMAQYWAEAGERWAVVEEPFQIDNFLGDPAFRHQKRRRKRKRIESVEDHNRGELMEVEYGMVVEEVVP
ncbi:hypothetical protein BC938DRAFT_482001 [Jimgerdemannia flammicorona]|uniref:Uncharacterized protein n=1 Tax=Jimgerdemannia flammicorona TaxID=994334 RepID=A0A433QWK2_9FUNG|nr:hypothetical protein BC938DRAFT_482001 [Jimgerdemannia flammicorona]